MQNQEDQSIRDRLNQIVAERSQSEVARKTGTQVAAVNRYVHGARIPAGFCASVVRELGVNPSWLLMGEGSPYLSDVPEQTARLGGNLLELVEAMSAVSNMLLGSLTGKQHLKVLRELNDALLAHERLRENLNVHSRPVFERLLADLRAALDDIDLDRAKRLREAADQLSRLCDDEALNHDYLSVCAYHEFQLKRSDRFLALQRRLFLRTITEPATFDEAACTEARRIVVALIQMNHMREAARLCRAIRAIAGRKGRRWAMWPLMQNTYGVLLGELGQLRKGLALIEKALPKLDGMHRKVAEASLARLLVLAGVLDFREAMELGNANDAKAARWLQIACWRRDADDLKAALSYAGRHGLEPVWGEGFAHHHASYLYRQVRRPSLEIAAEFERDFLETQIDTRDATAIFMSDVARCQMRRLAGDRKSAMDALKSADKTLRELLPERIPGPLQLATHYRNALELIDKPRGAQQQKLVKRAHRHFKRRIANGFICFEELAQEHTIRL